MSHDGTVEVLDLDGITLEITNFLGIKYQVIKFGPDGIIATGGNGLGKTTIERAWNAGTLGFDVEDIALGAELGKIAITAGKFALVRTVKHNGNDKVTVTVDGGKSEWKRTQERINEHFGRTLKPIAFMHASKAKQREMVLEAVQTGEITQEDIDRWVDDKDGIIKAAFELPDVTGKDGLEAVGILWQAFHDARKASKITAKAANAAAEAGRKKANDLARPEHVGLAVPTPGQEDVQVAAAKAARAELDARAARVAEQERKAAGTRERIAFLRKDADAEEFACGKATDRQEKSKLWANYEAANYEVLRLKDLLADAEKVRERALRLNNEACDHDDRCTENVRNAIQTRAKADELEASLAAVAIEPVTAEEIAKADQAIRDEERKAATIKAARAEHDAVVEHALLADKAKAAQAEVNALEKAVRNLADVAPKELIDRSGGIPGMALTDAGVTLDGIAYANLCGKEQMFFAIELCKRARRGKVKIIPIDSLETLDEEARVEFIRAAVSGGWKIVGTLVTGGPLTVIELDASKEIPEAITPIKALEKRLAEAKP